MEVALLEPGHIVSLVLWTRAFAPHFTKTHLPVTCAGVSVVIDSYRRLAFSRSGSAFRYLSVCGVSTFGLSLMAPTLHGVSASELTRGVPTRRSGDVPPPPPPYQISLKRTNVVRNAQVAGNYQN